MYRIFLTLCLFLSLLFCWTLWTGHSKSEQSPQDITHFTSGLFLALCTVGLHALVIVYFIGTGRTIKAAVQQIGLPKHYLERSNYWYQTRGYLWAGLSCLLTIATLVLGGALDSGRHSVYELHLVLAYFSTLFNFFTFYYEYKAIKTNGLLLQEMDNEVDRHPYQVIEPPKDSAEIELPAPFLLGQKLLFYGITLLFPYVFLNMGWGWEELPFWPFLTGCLLLSLPGILLKIIYRPSTWMPPLPEKKA